MLSPRARCWAVLATTWIFAACGGADDARSDAPTTDSGSTSDDGGTGEDGGADDDAAVGVGATVTHVRIESRATSEQRDVPVTFGEVFAPGAIREGESLAGKLEDGTLVPLQVDRKASHPDGSLRHAVISAVLPVLPAGAKLRLELVKTAASDAGVAASIPDLIEAGLDVSVRVTLDGKTYTAAAADALSTRKPTSWLSGDVATEWIVAAPLADGATEHPHLVARFAVRWYPSAKVAKVDVTLENGWAYEPGPQNLTYDVQIASGDTVAYAKEALTHYHHARFRTELWWGRAPAVHLAHDPAHLIATGALPNYQPGLEISEKALADLDAAWTGAKTEPMGSGLAVRAMGTTGGRRDIGLQPGWAVAWLLSQDERARKVTLGTAALAGSFSIHYRDKNTDRPLSVVDWPYSTLLGRPGDTVNPATKKSEAFPACGGTCTNPNAADSSHQPNFSYLPYLVTGDHFHLEELQFWAMFNVFQHNPYYREFAKGLVKPDQVRGQAWSLRTLGEAAWITPDDDPLRAHFDAVLSHNLDWFNTTYTDGAATNPLGFVTNGYALVYDDGRGLAPWQDDFFTSAIGHLADLGYEKAKKLLGWKAQFAVQRMVGPGFCWIFGAAYSMNVRESKTSPLATTAAAVYDASVDEKYRSLPCAGPEMAAALGLKVGEMTGYSSSSEGYPSNMQPALAYAVDAKIAGADDAWKVFAGRTVQPNYGTNAQFAIVPRVAP